MKPFAIAALAASALALTGCNGKIGSDPQLAVVAGYIQMGATPTALPRAISRSRAVRRMSNWSR